MGQGLPYKGRYVYQYGNKGRYRMEVVGVFVQIMNRGRGWMPVMGDVSDIDDQTLEVAQQAYSIGYVVTLLPVQKPDKAFSFGVAPSGTIEGEECAGVTIDHERPSCCFLTDSPQRTSHLLRSVVEPAILNRCAPAGLCEDWHYVAIVDTAIVWCRSVVCQPRRPVAPSHCRTVATPGTAYERKQDTRCRIFF